jgi:hypothetical protein
MRTRKTDEDAHGRENQPRAQPQSPSHPTLALQRSAGNAAVARLAARRGPALQRSAGNAAVARLAARRGLALPRSAGNAAVARLAARRVLARMPTTEA